MISIQKKTSFCFLFFTLIFGNSYADTVNLRSMGILCEMAEKETFRPHPASLRSPSKNSLLRAIEFGKNSSVIKDELNGANPDSVVINNMTPMHMAALTGNWPAAKVLLSAGADVNHEYKYNFGGTASPLTIATLNNQYAFACKLIQHGAALPTDKRMRNDLFGSALVMNPESFSRGATFINFLLENGFDVDDYGHPLETPLTAAVALNNIPTIKILLKHGARLDIVKRDGRTVWTVASEKNNPRVLQLLKDAQEKADAAKKAKPGELVRQ